MEQQHEKEKPVSVYAKDESYLSQCSTKRAARMVFRNKAKWIGRNKVMLIVTREDEKEIRKKVRLRDKDICYICDKKLTSDEITYDHLTPRSQGGEEALSNLACCCRPCNELKADRSVEEFTLCLAAWVLYHKIRYTN